MITMEQVQRLLFEQADVVGEDGKKIGTTGQVFLDAQSGEPAWVTVRTGLFGSAESFVPLTDAHSDGDAIRVPYGKDLVKHAPRIDSADGSLSPTEERELYRHYGLLHDDVEQPSGDRSADEVGTAAAGPVGYVQGAASGIGVEQERVGYVHDPGPVAPGPVAPGPVAPGPDDVDESGGAHRLGTAGADADGPRDAAPVDAADGGMVVQGELLRVVGTEQVPTERVRLKRYTVTEMRDVTMPVTREEVRVEHEPGRHVRDPDAPAEGTGPRSAPDTVPPTRTDAEGDRR
jgi:Domain of unknown function (DUF2382)/PRC-barrel domain